MVNIDELKGGGTVCVFVRHGEKDVEHHCLTERGKRETVEFGKALCSLEKRIRIFSSPEGRCVETAAIINHVVNKDKCEFHCSEILGKPGIQVQDEVAYTKLTDVTKCRDIFREWKDGLHSDAMRSVEAIKSGTMEFLKSTAIKNGITLYISQSGTVACTGYALGLVDYRADSVDWVNYLDGYILKL